MSVIPPPDSVYLGPWIAAPGHALHAYVTDGFLCDTGGQHMVLSFDEARGYLAELNSGWQAGDGTEAALRALINDGSDEFEGKFIFPPVDMLQHAISVALKDGRLPGVAAALRVALETDKPYRLWAYSCTLQPESQSLIRMVHLGQTVTAKTYMTYAVAGILPIQLFRQRSMEV